MKRLTAITLAMILILTMVAPVLAAENETIMPRFTYTNTIHVDIDIDATLGIAHCHGKCIAKNAVPVEIIVYLDRLNQSTGRWDNIKTWEASGTAVAALDGYFGIYSGYEYRVRIEGYVFNSNNTLVEIATAEESLFY